MIDRTAIYAAIDEERAYQDRKYGDIAERQLTLNTYVAIADAELTEVARSFHAGDIDNARCELVQVAAVAIAALEAHGLVTRAELEKRTLT